LLRRIIYTVYRKFVHFFYTVSFKEVNGAVLRLLDIADLADTMQVLSSGLFTNPASVWCEYGFAVPLLRIHGPSTPVPRPTGWELQDNINALDSGF
jgi:hypothetical protein